MSNFNPRQIQRYIPKQTAVTAQDINDIVTRVKRLENLTVAAPLQLASNVNAIGIGLDPDWFNQTNAWCFVKLKTSFIDSDGVPPGAQLEGFRIRQNQDKTYEASQETVKFDNLNGIFGEKNDIALLIKFPERYNHWVLGFVRQTLYRFVTLHQELTGTIGETSDWTDNDIGGVAGEATNYFGFDAPINSRALIMRAGNEWRIIQTTNPCIGTSPSPGDPGTLLVIDSVVANPSTGELTVTFSGSIDGTDFSLSGLSRSDSIHPADSIEQTEADILVYFSINWLGLGSGGTWNYSDTVTYVTTPQSGTIT